MPAVVEIVRRLWERHWAGTRPAPTVLCVVGDGSFASRRIGIYTPILDCAILFLVIDTVNMVLYS